MGNVNIIPEKGANMKREFWQLVALVIALTVITGWGLPHAAAADLLKPNAAFDVNKMGDMSDFDPNNPVIPTGDTIKIALVASFSGPAALVGQIYYISVLWRILYIHAFVLLLKAILYL